MKPPGLSCAAQRRSAMSSAKIFGEVGTGETCREVSLAGCYMLVTCIQGYEGLSRKVMSSEKYLAFSPLPAAPCPGTSPRVTVPPFDPARTLPHLPPLDPRHPLVIHPTSPTHKRGALRLSRLPSPTPRPRRFVSSTTPLISLDASGALASSHITTVPSTASPSPLPSQRPASQSHLTCDPDNPRHAWRAAAPTLRLRSKAQIMMWSSSWCAGELPERSEAA